MPYQGYAISGGYVSSQEGKPILVRRSQFLELQGDGTVTRPPSEAQCGTGGVEIHRIVYLGFGVHQTPKMEI